MGSIRKPGPWNPQKATAYVGKGVLKNGDSIPAIKGAITPVPNGPLIKKKGPFKGSTLKKGGTVKKAQLGDTVKSAAFVMKNGGKLKAIVKAGGQTHKVFKNKKGDIVVDHTAGPSAGKWDKINLTKKSKAKTVKQGVASVKKWHKDNPDYYGKKSSMAKKRR
jgi:hypothetical protein